jgi:DNA-binding winged helix-turn-helix (wHTH) protein
MGDGRMDIAPELRPASSRDRVVLAHENSFSLGGLFVTPAKRVIDHWDGRCEVLEPRVMQVLVALARVNGSTLTRGDLTELCWEGRVVGEDAICRVISRLRRTARSFADGLFQIETTVRVGYRLVVNRDPRDREPRSISKSAAAEGVAQEGAYFALTQAPGADCARLVEQIRQIADVGMIHGTSGAANLLVRLDSRSIADVEIGRAAIGAIAGIGKVETSIVLVRYSG